MRLCDMTHYSTVRDALARIFSGYCDAGANGNPSNRGECLLKIRNEIVNVLDADR